MKLSPMRGEASEKKVKPGEGKTTKPSPHQSQYLCGFEAIGEGSEGFFIF